MDYKLKCGQSDQKDFHGNDDGSAVVKLTIPKQPEHQSLLLPH